nr:MAG TPA: hypothetical protein [Caudoviricetes sp.]
MTQAQTDARFTLLCSEINAALTGKRGALKPHHVIEIRDRLLEKLAATRQSNRRGQHLLPNQVDEMCDLFTDITGIDIPA